MADLTTITVGDCMWRARAAASAGDMVTYSQWVAMVERTVLDKGCVPLEFPVLIRPPGAH